MMRNAKQELNLHQPATYQIRVPGMPEESWSEWLSGMTIAVERKGEKPPLTILTGTVDQASLLGLLRRLYSLGLPLVSVECIDGQPSDQARS
jgi:hypothetical protein